MWNELSGIWQAAFREAWEAFIQGSPPIGAVLCGSDGRIIMCEHNRNNEPHILNKRLAHAEAGILRRLDTAEYDPRDLVLYSTMEPCPMCMGTIIMSNIKRVHYAAADSYCGMTHLTRTEPYYSSKNVSCFHEGGEPEKFQLTIQAYYELRNIEQGAGSCVFEKFREHCPSAAETAVRLFAERWLDKAADSKTDVSEVYDNIMNG